jgi:predicted nuclease with TOPRIM domain
VLQASSDGVEGESVTQDEEIERLREARSRLSEQVDELEQSESVLQARVQRLEAALREIAAMTPFSVEYGVVKAPATACAALEEQG